MELITSPPSLNRPARSGGNDKRAHTLPRNSVKLENNVTNENRMAFLINRLKAMKSEGQKLLPAHRCAAIQSPNSGVHSRV